MSKDALMLALEALKQSKPQLYGLSAQIAHEKAITSIRQAIAEAEKEEQGEFVRGVYWKCVLCGFAHIEDECPECGHHTRGEFSFPHPQPKREPLTAEQIAEIIGNMKFITPSRIAQAIEAAHGIKGEA